MATSKIDLFGVLDGIDFHLELTPSENESAITLLQQATKKLKDMGAMPRIQPRNGGGQGNRKPQEFVPDLKCDVCGGGVVEKAGTSKAGKPYTLRVCASNQEGHYKKFL